MQIIAKKTLKDFWQTHKETEEPLKAWYYEAKHSNWNSPQDIKDKYRSASIIKNKRVVFNIKGNKYRLVVQINYEKHIVSIRFIGTHKQYDKINAEEI
ncbi:MAG: type II toxin-antitoxin system HigB family toxin [Pseudomonadota bacterium]